MARVLGPDLVALQVRDLEASARFYEESEVERLGWGVALWLKCDDAGELCASLEEGGVAIVQRPFDGPFGRTFTFVDPDGYTVTVHGG